MEWIFAAYLGTAHTRPATIEITQPTAIVQSDRIAFEGRSFSPPVYYGYRVSLFSEGGAIGIEAEMIHLKVYAVELPHEAILKSFSISHGLNLLLANVARRWTVVSNGEVPRVQFVARGGIGRTLPHPESNVNGIEYSGYEWGGAVGQLSGGVIVRATRRLALNVEYKLTGTPQSVTVSGGKATGTFVSHHVTIGAGWHLR